MASIFDLDENTAALILQQLAPSDPWKAVLRFPMAPKGLPESCSLGALQQNKVDNAYA